MSVRIVLAAVALAAAGCGGGEKMAEWAPAQEPWSGDTAGATLGAPAPAARPEAEPSREADEEADLAYAGPHDRLGRADGMAEGAPPQDGQGGPGQGGPGQGGPGQGGQGRAADPKEPPPAGPLLIYQATVHLAVHEVMSRQRAVLEIARELGGFLASQDDQRIVIRVPARRFAEALAKVETVGDLLHKNVQADDVSEQYRDLSLRLRNAEVVRERLEELLKKADKVEDALKVAKELSDVTEKIELLKGKLRFLQDRIALSTITVLFQPKSTQPVEPQGARLPFGFLDELGLPNLFNLYSN